MLSVTGVLIWLKKRRAVRQQKIPESLAMGVGEFRCRGRIQGHEESTRAQGRCQEIRDGSRQRNSLSLCLFVSFMPLRALPIRKTTLPNWTR
jgi:hypothetical protein